MIIVNGGEISRRIIEELKQKPPPAQRLVAVLVGNDSAAAIFIKEKAKVSRELGVAFEAIELAEVITEEELEEQVRTLSNDLSVGGVIVQLPLPKRFDREAVLTQLLSEKDVDNLTGRAAVESPAVAVVKEIIYWFTKSIDWQWEGKTVAVVGASGFLVGRPISRWLKNFQFSIFNFQLKTADIETENLQEFLADADLVITGVGKEGLIKPEWLKPGAGVIDFGFPSDLFQSPTSNLQHLSFYTPTPGGTGPILVAKLFENFYRLCG